MITRIALKLLSWLPTRKIYCPIKGDLYLVRYTLLAVLGRRIYIHHIIHGDRRTDLHDHPWRFVSIVLAGRMAEQGPGGGKLLRRGPGSIVSMNAWGTHRIRHVIGDGCWTLVFTGKRNYEWGFVTKLGWQDHEYYHSIVHTMQPGGHTDER